MQTGGGILRPLFCTVDGRALGEDATMTPFGERVRGVILGTAFGDALGAPVEKLSHDEIRQRYGRVESLNTKWHKADWDADRRLHRVRGNGIVTDDTLMTLALVNVYQAKMRHIDAFDFATAFIKEIAYRPCYIPEFGREALIIDRLFYPEKYPFLRLSLANCDPRDAGVGNMVNCGAAMYIAPVGVVNACNPKAAYDEAIAFSSAHQSSYGLEAAGVLAACIAQAFRPDAKPADLVETALSLAKDGTHAAILAIHRAAQELKAAGADADTVVNRFHAVIRDYSPMGDDVNRSVERVGMPSNYYTPSRLFSIEELPIALGYIELHDGDLIPAICDGVNSGRDTDSIGAMIGSMLGALHGGRSLSEDVVQALEEANRLNLVQQADALAEAARHIIGNDLSENQKTAEHLRSIGL